MRSTVACAAPALPPPCLASSQGLLHVCKAPWWADAVFCCAGARFRTAGLEDAGQPALGSSPEPQQLSEDKPQVLAQPFPPTLPTFGSGMCRCWGGWHLPLCCPSLAVGSLTPGKATQDGSCRSSGGQGSQWLLWNPAGYSWMLGWHLYRPIEKSWKLRLGICKASSLWRPLPPSHPFCFPGGGSGSRGGGASSLVSMAGQARAHVEKASPFCFLVVSASNGQSTAGCQPPGRAW